MSKNRTRTSPGLIPARQDERFDHSKNTAGQFFGNGITFRDFLVTIVHPVDASLDFVIDNAYYPVQGYPYYCK